MNVLSVSFVGERDRFFPLSLSLLPREGSGGESTVEHARSVTTSVSCLFHLKSPIVEKHVFILIFVTFFGWAIALSSAQISLWISKRPQEAFSGNIYSLNPFSPSLVAISLCSTLLTLAAGGPLCKCCTNWLSESLSPCASPVT